MVHPLALRQIAEAGSVLCLSDLANKPPAVIKVLSRMKAGRMIDRVSLIGERLKSDDMTWHGSIMAAFVLLGGLFNYLYQLAMGRMLAPAE